MAVLTRQMQEPESRSEALLDRIVDASTASVVAAHEKRAQKLERDRLVLAAKASPCVPPPGRLEEVIAATLVLLTSL